MKVRHNGLRISFAMLWPRGLGHRPFTPATGVRIPLGTPKQDTDMTGKLGSTDFPVFVLG